MKSLFLVGLSFFIFYLIGNRRAVSELGEDGSWFLSEYNLLFLMMRDGIFWLVLFEVDVFFVEFVLAVWCT
jgi:hypothetical protein